jgi:O-antigen/teichoic acid export membrane protein
MNPTNLVGQLRPIVFFKGLEVAGLALFAVLMPRYLGPELFGRFAVILSLSTLWMTTSNLGARYVFGRFVPEYATSEASHRVRELFMHMIGSRLLLVALGAPVFAFVLHGALPEASTLVLALSTASFVAMTMASPMFSIFFGFNQLGASMGREAFGRVALLSLLVLAGASAGLERATGVLLLTQAGALATGVYLCRGLFVFDRSALEWRSALFHLRFGLAVFAANLLLRLPWRLGESALAYAGTERAEIAYFSIALSAAAGFTKLLGGLTTLQLPELSLKHVAGDNAGRDHNLGIALKFLNVLSVLFVLASFAAGPWAVQHLWGRGFLGVLPNLLLAAPTTLSQPFVRTALSLAVVERRLTRNFELGVAGVAAFVPAAWLLVPRFGAPGATAALLADSLASAGLAIFRLRPTGVLAAARSGRHLAAAALAAGVLLATHGTPLGAVVATALYLGALFALGIVRRDEIAAVVRPFRLRRAEA